MFFLDSSNTRYYLHRPFTHNGIQYSSRAATEALYTSLGFTKVTIGAVPDRRFHFVTGPNNSGAYTSTDKPLDELKDTFIDQTKNEARTLLQPTDWHIIHNVEDSNHTIPSDVVSYRAAVKVASTARCNEINAVTTVAALKTLIIDQTGFTQFPVIPEGGNYTTY